MLTPILVMSGIGTIAAIGLGIAGKIFYVDEDPRIKHVLDLLPGANCGGCGFAGCSACAEALVEGSAPASICVVGGAETAGEIAGYLGLGDVNIEPQMATPDCKGGSRAIKKYTYSGFDDCRAAMQYYRGPIECDHGCIGLVTCVKACKFGAIEMGHEGLPVFDPDRCVGCGECVRACPKGIISVISEKTKILHWNQYTECLAPCRQKCPAQINIPKYIKFIREGKYTEALLTIKERNPLPLVCGRVCPEPCALACRRSIEDEPVAINYLKRFVADWEMEQGTRLPIPISPSTGYRVAIVGGGPAGLTAAYFLRRLGHEVEIFELKPKLGGMLRYGIPEYRLPKKILDWEIQGILDLGVKVTTTVEFGKDFTLELLKAEGFQSVILAVGAWSEHQLKIEGDHLEGVYSGINFLEQFHGDSLPPVGKRVVVIGGGNTAMDAARSSLRLGSEKVTIVYRRSRDEMPANPAEIVAAEEENIEFAFLSAPNRILGDSGKVTSLEVLAMKLGESDKDGRRRPVVIEGSERIIECDTIIQAIGQFPDLKFNHGPMKLELPETRWHTIDAEETTLQTDIPDIFTAGDCFTGPGLAVEAIAAGRYVAQSVHYHMTEGEIPPIYDQQKDFIYGSLHESILGVHSTPKIHESVICLEDRLGTFLEVEGTINEQDALNESKRCLDCGVYCYSEDPPELQQVSQVGIAEIKVSQN